MEILNRTIGESEKPYIIAEISANHNGSIDRAKACMKAAYECKADAIKIQTYMADTMTINCQSDDFIIKGGLWDGYCLYDLYKEAETPYEWHVELFRYAKELGITLFSTPFDSTAVDLLEDLGTPAYKIASFELTDLPLIAKVASQKKPMLMSTGMASIFEIEEAVDCAVENGCESILLFHCTSSYPAPINQANLRSILTLREKFGCEVGLSDHSMGVVAPIAAVALGATAIEKHFTLNKNDKGPDSAFSMEPEDLKLLVDSTEKAWLSLGSKRVATQQCEEASLQFRRSIYFVRPLSKGEVIKPSDVKVIRPGFAMAPKFIDEIIGKTILSDVHPGDRVSKELMCD